MNGIFKLIAVGFCAALGAFEAVAANIVSNPGFETGDLSAWTISGAHSGADDNGIYYGVDAVDAHSGAAGAFFGPIGGVLNLSQTLATTPGDTYSVTVWVAQSPEATPPYVNSLDVTFGGATLFSQTGVPDAGYTQYSFSATATAASTALVFGFRDDLGFFSLDDISVSSGAPAGVPEPASTLLALSGLACGVGWGARRRLNRKL